MHGVMISHDLHYYLPFWWMLHQSNRAEAWYVCFIPRPDVTGVIIHPLRMFHELRQHDDVHSKTHFVRIAAVCHSYTHNNAT